MRYTEERKVVGLHGFYRATRIARYGICCVFRPIRPSVRASVCLSVTLVWCVLCRNCGRNNRDDYQAVSTGLQVSSLRTPNIEHTGWVKLNETNFHFCL